jgi:exopolysaccharide production protein ExoQ
LQTPDSLRPRQPLPFVDGFVVFAMLVFSTSILQLLLGTSSEDAEPLLYRAALLLIYAVAGALAATSGAALGTIALCPMVLAVLSLPVLSVMWSVEPTQTIERTVGFLGTILLGLFMGWHYRLEDMLRLVGWALLIGTLLSFGAILLLPSIGIDQSPHLGGTWLGIHLHKSKLGGASSAGLVTLFYASLCSSGAARHLFILGAFLNLVLLIGAYSATNFVAATVGVCLGLFILMLQYRARFGCLLMIVGALFGPLVAAIALRFDLFQLFVEALGKDATMTNRVPLWHLLWPFVEDRFWFGYGFGAFWESGLPWVNLIEARMNFLPHYSHNGVIELWLGGGLVIVIAFLSVYLLTLVKAGIFAFNSPASPAAGYPFACLIMIAIVNVTEARAIARNDFLLVLFGALICICARKVVLRVGRSRPDTYAGTTRLLGASSQGRRPSP